MNKLVLALSTLAFAASLGSAAAQTARTATIQPGKPARVAVVTALKRDCSLGEVGSIRVVTAPKNGSLVVRGGKLKTPANFRCPSVETPVQALFYEPNRNYQGADEIAYETRSTDGSVQSFTLKITVTSKPAAAPSGGLQEL
ncbi:4-aminobutyrate aminotransferase [Enterovirga sp.]|jgi:hypothetical protein|uniref:4-aminobutyrate aminotransferase n=1 Tax=Enterovirga sp. TaxID=2026350 RepID=UPI00260CC24E|nr:4-aminobutyrate aminotransferase [Enterovirga sp.]MDB5591765.1 4-aminobutyrate aminotransferase [Enterovirga sp.]